MQISGLPRHFLAITIEHFPIHCIPNQQFSISTSSHDSYISSLQSRVRSIASYKIHLQNVLLLQEKNGPFYIMALTNTSELLTWPKDI